MWCLIGPIELDLCHIREEFIRSNPAAIRHFDSNYLEGLTKGYLLDKAYAAFWKRDFTSAYRLFRAIGKSGYWRLRDIVYIVPCFLPESLYRYAMRIFLRIPQDNVGWIWWNSLHGLGEQYDSQTLGVHPNRWIRGNRIRMYQGFRLIIGLDEIQKSVGISLEDWIFHFQGSESWM